MASARRAGLALAAALLACGPEDVPPETGRPAAPPADLADLRALGYGGDAEGAELLGKNGVRIHDGTRVSPGLNLYTDEVDQVRLIDNRGELVRTWRIPGFDQVEFAERLADGGVVAVSVDQGVARVDRDGGLLWRFTGNAHHEVAPLRDGRFVTLVWREHRFRGRRVRFDELVWLSPGGRELSRWSSWEHRRELAALHPPLALDQAPAEGEEDAGDTVYDYYHLNSVAELGETALGRRDGRFAAGHLLVCARNASLVFVLDPETERVVWSFGPGELDFPHMPRPTPEGTFTVFDNGWHRGWSRVLELAPDTGEVVWSWRAQPPESFFTRRRGSCQRLPNGNTLVCASAAGHVFELTPGGEIVWEFRNPPREGRRRRIYRFTRVPDVR